MLWPDTRRRPKEQQAQYKDWLQSGLAKGMRPLYSSLRKSERVLDRPFQNLPGEERPGARRKQWVAIWGEVETSPPIGRTLLDAAKSSQLFKKTANVLEAILKTVTDKAGGLDGLTYAALKNLPDPAYEQLTQALNLAEATGVAPQHWQVHHVALLPKNADIERSITLTSITYRLWCFCRAQVVKKWMRETAEQFPWDKASPGNTCLETGMQRLLRGEVSRAANKHACAVLLDLQTFYDSVNWTKLEERIVATGFPPAIALLVMQVYRGTRYLVAEDLLSEGILPARGILAGCPFATMMARVYLQPIMQEAAQLHSITALDTWVDDIGADFEARHPEQAAFAVYEGYKTLRRLLEGSDLRLSLKKTGFLCTTAEARRELQKLRKDGDPAICDSMKDLGLDCALGRVRRVKVQRARRHKAGHRQKKLNN